MQIQAVPDPGATKTDAEARNKRVEMPAEKPATALEFEPIFPVHPVRAVKLNAHTLYNIDTGD